MKRIVLLIGKPSRETTILETLKKEILRLEPNTKVQVWYRFKTDLIKDVIAFKPDVILTTPFGSVGLSKVFYLFKFLLKCRVITLCDEGVVDFKVKMNVEWAVGSDKYGKNLLDYEILSYLCRP